jgi:hypothetical protein
MVSRLKLLLLTTTALNLLGCLLKRGRGHVEKWTKVGASLQVDWLDSSKDLG